MRRYSLRILFLAIMAAASIQVNLVLRLLDRLRGEVEQIRYNNSTGIRGAFPEELQPLIGELNDLLVIRENSLQFARARAADLAHGIKRRFQSSWLSQTDLKPEGDRSNADEMHVLSDEISDRIGYQLQRARLRLRSESEAISSSLTEALRRTLDVLQRTQKGEQIRWTVNASLPVEVDTDRHDLIELLGTLLENACNWACAEVAVTVAVENATARMSICDDGPGVREEQIATLGLRGGRLDESLPGTGMGLYRQTDCIP